MSLVPELVSILLPILLPLKTQVGELTSIHFGPWPAEASTNPSSGTCPATSPCTVVNTPGGLAWDGTHLWVGSYDLSVTTIFKVDVATCTVVHSIPAPGTGVGIGGLAWDGSALWACPEQEGRIYRLDPHDGSVLHFIDGTGFGDTDPDATGLAWDGVALWQNDHLDNQIYRLDPVTGTVLDAIPSPGMWGGGLAYCQGVLVSYDVLTMSNYEIDAETGTILSSCLVPVPHQWGKAIDNAGDVLTGFWSGDTVYRQDADLCRYRKFCTSNPNSTGAPALISASGSASVADGSLLLSSTPIPNQNGIFFHGSSRMQNAFGCGFLCTGMGIVRGSVVLATANSASYAYDNSNPMHSLSAHVGSTRHFQHWFRDPMHAGSCGNTFNTSDGVSVVVQP